MVIQTFFNDAKAGKFGHRLFLGNLIELQNQNAWAVELFAMWQVCCCLDYCGMTVLSPRAATNV